jgi:hypothetical protein
VSHNGGSSVGDVNPVNQGLFCFVNIMKSISNVTWESGVYDGSLYFNQYSYLKTTPPVRVRGTIDIPPFPSAYGGSYRMSGAGYHDITLEPSGAHNPVLANFTVISGSATLVTNTLSARITGTDFVVKFDFLCDPFSRITVYQADGNANTGDLRFYRDDHASIIDTDTFTPDYLTAMRTLNTGTYRPLDWTLVNFVDGFIEWGQRATTSQISYNIGRFFPNKRVGNLTVIGNAATCGTYPDSPGGSYVHGEYIQGWVPASGGGYTITSLNVAGRGVKTVRSQTSTLGVSIGTSGANISFWYDGNFDAFICPQSGGGGSPYGNFIGDVVPLEVRIEHSNKLNANYWHQFSLMASDDLINKQASLIRDTLGNGLLAKYEMCNELWNTQSSPFYYLQYWGHDKLGIPIDSNQSNLHCAALRFYSMCAQIESVYSGQMSRCKRILGVQGTVNDTYTYKPWLFEGQDFPGPPSIWNRPIDHCDIIAPAAYLMGKWCRQGPGEYDGNLSTCGLLAQADNYDSGVPASMSTALDWVDADLRVSDGTVSDSLYNFQHSHWLRWNTDAVNYGADTGRTINVENYEGSIAIGAPDQAKCTALGIATAYAQKIQNLFNAYKNDARAKKYLLDVHVAFKGISNALGMAQYLYFSCSTSSESYYPWPLLSGNLYSTKPPTWDAIAEWNSHRRGTSIASLWA